MGGYKKIEGNRITKEDWKNELTKVVKQLKIDDYDIAFFDDEMQHIDTKPQQELIEHIESKSKISISSLVIIDKIPSTETISPIIWNLLVFSILNKKHNKIITAGIAVLKRVALITCVWIKDK